MSQRGSTNECKSDKPQQCATNLLEEDKSPRVAGVPLTEAGHRNQRLEYYHKKLECHHHQESQFRCHPATHLLLRPRSNILLWLG